MKRLFKVCNNESHKPVAERFFESKQEAKKFRNELNDGGNLFKVSLGPDHRHYKGA